MTIDNINASVKLKTDSGDQTQGAGGKAKLIALYFPQLHAIPENDAWWGKGFTDWENVRSGTPQYPDHYQPRVPLDNNYYDQSTISTLRWQVDLAKKHGVHGFCQYHYWFDGKQLLETPTNLMLANPDIDFPFCLSWANETWTRRWDGRGHQVLIEQTHPPTEESWKRHFDYLIKVWTDPRAIKVDDKPVFAIYRPQRIERIDEMLGYWRKLAIKEGLPGLYFIFQKQYELPNFACLNSFDAIFQFQPFESINAPSYRNDSVGNSILLKLMRSLPERYQDVLRTLKGKIFNQLTLHDYDAAWRKAIEIRSDNKLVTFPGAFVDWDNTARYKHRATIFREATPERFAAWFDQLVESMPKRNLPENFIFLNAWNEWSEGAYLEPDEKYGLQYLEAIRKVLALNHADQSRQVMSSPSLDRIKR